MREAFASPWLLVKEAAEYAHMSEHRMRALVRSGEIPSHRHPDSRTGTLVHASDVDQYLFGLPSGATVPERLQSPRR